MSCRLVAILIVVAALAVGCGKRGPPEPPGPPEDITYPKVYPNR
jgi:predicted small lipoprotein YifL